MDRVMPSGGKVSRVASSCEGARVQRRERVEFERLWNRGTMVLRGRSRPDWTEVRMGHCFLGGQSFLDIRLAFFR